MNGARRPLIGVTGRRWPASIVAGRLPVSFHDAEFDFHFTEYGEKVAGAGGLPVELTRDAPVEELVDRLDGLVLTGGADIDPAAYGHEPSPQLGPTEPDRDAWELEVLDAALRLGRPVLAICRGMQLLNVHRGGTLVQHVGLDDGDGHPRFDEPRDEPGHRVLLERGSAAHAVYGERIEVNSLHHQLVDRIGDGLVVTGRAVDGAVEVLELPGAPLLAVQWHPEALRGVDPSFDWLVRVSRRGTIG